MPDDRRSRRDPHGEGCGHALGELLRRAYEDFKAAAAKEYPLLKPGARNLLAREALKKQNEVQSFCGRLEDRDASRFNGLLGLGLFGIL